MKSMRLLNAILTSMWLQKLPLGLDLTRNQDIKGKLPQQIPGNPATDHD